jgi:hypothetical protein
VIVRFGWFNSVLIKQSMSPCVNHLGKTIRV